MALVLGSLEAGFGRKTVCGFFKIRRIRAPGNPSIFWPTKPPDPLFRRRQLTLMTAERDGLQRQVEEQTRAAHQLQELVRPQHTGQHRTGSHQAGLCWGIRLGGFCGRF